MDVFKLRDGSGEIDARHWVEDWCGVDFDRDDDDIMCAFSFVLFQILKSHVLSVYSHQGKFVRFTGSIKTFQDRRYIKAKIIRVLEDQNEAYFHFNEVMVVTLYHRHGTVRAHSPIFLSLTRTSRCCQPKERQEADSATYANVSVSNQSTTNSINNEQFDDPQPIQREDLEYINNDQFDDPPPMQRGGLEHIRAHNPIPEEGHHVRTLANGVQQQQITNEPNGTHPDSNVTNAPVSNDHQSITNYINNEQLDDPPPMQRAGLEHIRAHNPISEERHHIRRLANGVQHIINGQNGTHPYSNVAVRAGSDYAGRTMTDRSFANTWANPPPAVHGRHYPMVATTGVGNVHASAQHGYSPQQQHQQQPQRKSKGIFALLCRCG